MAAATAVQPGGRSADRTLAEPTWLPPVRAGLAALLGFACAISAFLGAYYDLGVWGWIGLGLLTATLVLVTGAGAPTRTSFLLVVGGLVALWAWALLSSTWAESSSSAILAAGRFLTYAAFVVVVAYLVRDRLAVLGLFGGIALGGAVLVVYLVVQLSGSDGPSTFASRRLADPIGYVNALGTYLLVAAFWPAVALAERARPVALAALGAGFASLATSLMLLTQSRGVAAAVVASIVVVLVAVPGRLARAWLLVLVGSGVAAAAPTLLDVYDSTGGDLPTPASTHAAVRAALIAAIAVALAWAAGIVLVRALSEPARRILAAVALGALAALAVAAVVVLVIFSGRLSNTIHHQYDEFVHPGARAQVSDAEASSRLVSGVGNRYDLWRIAWHDFTAHPLDGVGAGNYPVSYFRARRTVENVKQPHSIELQTLGELGLVGGIALLVLLVGVYAGLVGRRWASRGDQTMRAVTVAAGGAFTGWLIHTSVDWMVLMPGLTGIALASAAALVGDSHQPQLARRRVPLPVLVPILLVVGLGASFMVRQTLADHYRTQGQAEVASNPRGAVADANRALAYDGDQIGAYYVKAAAYARTGDYTSSRATLLAAARREPHAWVTYALLGDLSARAGNVRAARAAYVRALALNPREPGLRKLVASPRLALTGAG